MLRPKTRPKIRVQDSSHEQDLQCKPHDKIKTLKSRSQNTLRQAIRTRDYITE